MDKVTVAIINEAGQLIVVRKTREQLVKRTHLQYSDDNSIEEIVEAYVHNEYGYSCMSQIIESFTIEF